MSQKRREAVAGGLVVAVLLLEVGCFLWLRAHYLGLFGAASTPRPADLGGSVSLMWAMGLLCLVAALAAAHRVVMVMRFWLMVPLLLLCLLEVFIPTAVIYAMFVIQGWV